jgi:recombination protein U
MARGRANRGKYFEDWVDMSNAHYNAKGMAVITKIPTPWKVQRKYSPFKKTYEIANAFPEKKSTVDFGGTAAKMSIWFDVKVTTNKTSFPLANIHKHQIDYLRSVHEQGGKAFLMIHSEVHKRTWLIWIDVLIDFMETNTRKSILFSWMDTHCSEVKSNNGIILDYLPLILQKEG